MRPWGHKATHMRGEREKRSRRSRRLPIPTVVDLRLRPRPRGSRTTPVPGPLWTPFLWSGALVGVCGGGRAGVKVRGGFGLGWGVRLGVQVDFYFSFFIMGGWVGGRD